MRTGNHRLDLVSDRVADLYEFTRRLALLPALSDVRLGDAGAAAEQALDALGAFTDILTLDDDFMAEMGLDPEVDDDLSLDDLVELILVHRLRLLNVSWARIAEASTFSATGLVSKYKEILDDWTGILDNEANTKEEADDESQ